MSSLSVDQRPGGGGGPSRGVIGQRVRGGREAGEGGGAKGNGDRLVPEAHEGKGETGVE